MESSVPRKPAGRAGAKTKISVTLDPELLDWVAKHAGPGREFASISHALERGIVALQKTKGA